MITLIPGRETFGSGLSQGLEQLAQIKMQHVMQRHEEQHKQQQIEQAWGAVPEVDKTLAHALALADPKDRSTILSAYLSNTPEQQSGQAAGLGQSGQVAGLGQQQQQGGFAGQMQNLQPNQQPTTSPMQQAPVNPLSPKQRLLRAIESPAIKLHRESMEQQEQLAHEKMAQNERLTHEKMSVKQQAEMAARKATKAKEFDDITRSIASADKQMQGYDQIIQAAESGELVAGPVRALLESKNAQDIFTNPLTALTEKNVKNAFSEEFKHLKLGGRPSAFIFSEISKGWPSLRQYPEAMAIIAYLKKADTQAGKLEDEKYMQLATKYDKEGKDYPATMRYQAQQLVKKDTAEILQDAKHYYDRGVFNILMKSKQDMAGGYTGKTYNTLEESTQNLTPGKFIVNEQTGETWGKDAKGVYKAQYINGNWRRGRD